MAKHETIEKGGEENENTPNLTTQRPSPLSFRYLSVLSSVQASIKHAIESKLFFTYNGARSPLFGS